MKSHNTERPDWRRFDSVRSIRDVARVAVTSLLTASVRKYERQYDATITDIGDLPLSEYHVETPCATEEELDDMRMARDIQMRKYMESDK